VLLLWNDMMDESKRTTYCSSPMRGDAATSKLRPLTLLTSVRRSQMADIVLAPQTPSPLGNCDSSWTATTSYRAIVLAKASSTLDFEALLTPRFWMLKVAKKMPLQVLPAVRVCAGVGDVGARVGAVGTFVGAVGAFVGAVGAFVGTVGAIVGAVGAFVGAVGAFVGAVGTFVGAVGAFVGAVGAGVGDVGANIGVVGADSVGDRPMNVVVSVGQCGVGDVVGASVGDDVAETAGDGVGTAVGAEVHFLQKAL
jgi:hypothetical protein